MKLLTPIAMLMLTVPALAQPNPPSPDMQALHQRVLNEIQTNLQCTSVNIQLNNKIKELEAKLKEKVEGDERTKK